ncbi:MAG: prolipoprotein diacylglyceryl transferase [Ruminiclostridium sp.]|nr:prolipoprotein diacylglyceryl transferase [Ruminiclostridium sp.]
MFPGFTVFDTFISSYAVAAAAGVFSAGITAMVRYKKITGNNYPMLIVLLFSTIGILLGGSILYGITKIEYWHYIFEANDFWTAIRVIGLIFGGLVFYGGLLGGMLAAGIVIKINKYPGELITDVAAPSAALFHAFGRIGCFLGGCCYGIESDFGFVFTHSLNTSANGVRRLPVQLFESGFEFILFFLLSYLLKKGRLKGRLFSLYLVLYGIFRFIIEFFRGDSYRGFIMGLSTSQFISIFVVIGAAVYLAVRTMKDKHEPDNA